MIFIYAFMVYTNDNISRIFFFFFFILSKFWFSRFLGGSKGQNIVHKKLCTLHLISKEPYIIWLSFVVHKCKLMISPGFFSKFWFFSKRTKNGPKWEKILPVELDISGTIHHMIIIRGRKCKMIIFPGVFFHFFKTLIFWFVSGIKGQKMIQDDKNFCLLCLISQESLFFVHMQRRKYLLIFFQFLIFVANNRVKGLNMT